MRELLKYLKEYKVQSILAPLFKFLEAMFELCIPIMMTLIIDNGLNIGGEPNLPYIYKILAIMVAMAILGWGSAACAQYFAAVAGMGAGKNLRSTCFKHLNKLTNSDIDKFGSATIINRINSDTNSVARAINRFLRLFLRAPFIVVGAVIMSFIMNKWMGIILLCIVPISGLIIYLITKFTIKKYSDIQYSQDEVAQMAKENIDGVRVVRAFSKQENEKKEFSTLADALYKKQVNVAKISSLLNPLTYVVTNLAVVLVLYFGGALVDAGDITAGAITAFVNYAFQILHAIIATSHLFVMLAQGVAGWKRVDEFLKVEPSFKEKEDAVKCIDNPSDKIIEFKDVDFAFNESKPVLENISFTINKGECVGIIGSTGSGKTTLINLIPRLYDISDGEILFEGINIKDLDLSFLRSKISIAEQHAKLVKGTIRTNLLMGNPNASDEEMIGALSKAEAYDFVLDKGGLDAEVQKSGNNFSGGQKQRLNIARALIKNADVIVLDDCFSALDYATDAALRKSIKSIEGMTTIIVSQRISSIVNADKIIVLEEGHIVGIGSHDELLNNNEVYTEIYNSQVKKEALYE